MRGGQTTYTEMRGAAGFGLLMGECGTTVVLEKRREKKETRQVGSQVVKGWEGCRVFCRQLKREKCRVSGLRDRVDGTCRSRSSWCGGGVVGDGWWVVGVSRSLKSQEELARGGEACAKETLKDARERHHPSPLGRRQGLSREAHQCLAGQDRTGQRTGTGEAQGMARRGKTGLSVDSSAGPRAIQPSQWEQARRSPPQPAEAASDMARATE